LDKGRSTMKSMVIMLQTSVGTWFGFSGTRVLDRTLVDWHAAHPSTNSSTKTDMPGHQNSRETSL
jgi:hypothetical protein